MDYYLLLNSQVSVTEIGLVNLLHGNGQTGNSGN